LLHAIPHIPKNIIDNETHLKLGLAGIAAQAYTMHLLPPPHCGLRDIVEDVSVCVADRALLSCGFRAETHHDKTGRNHLLAKANLIFTGRIQTNH